jgi:5-methylcytosine-specific restriction endonuclease McrA
MAQVLGWPETRRRFSLMPIGKHEFEELAARLADRWSTLELACDVQNCEPGVARERLKSSAQGRRRSVNRTVGDIIAMYAVDAGAQVPVTTRRVAVPSTNRLLAEALKQLYADRCQICDATFRTRQGGKYSEVHHVQPRTDGGPHAPQNMLVLCATCHRKLHFATVEGASSALETGRLTINGRLRRLTVHPCHPCSE